MSLISGAAALGSAVTGIGSIANTLFPDQRRIKIPDVDVEVNIDAMVSATINTSIIKSEHPAEGGKVFAQNIYKNPRSITMTCVLSSVLRASGIDSVSSATQFGASLLIPEVGNIVNLALNEEDSIATRLKDLRDAQDLGLIVQVLGLPNQEVFNFVIEDITDNENVETGPNSRAVDIVLSEVFIVGLDSPAGEEGGLFSAITDTITSAINSIPGEIGTQIALSGL